MFDFLRENTMFLNSLMRRMPYARALIRGSDQYPKIIGNTLFYQTSYGVIVITQIKGLPDPSDNCSSPVFGFHIHAGDQCAGDMTDPFRLALGHYNPDDCPHPYHAGDMPPLFGNNGNAFGAFLTNRFKVDEIVDKTVVVHDMPDDFTSQPAGNSGNRIACGVIERVGATKPQPR